MHFIAFTCKERPTVYVDTVQTCLRAKRVLSCIGQMEALTCPPPGKPRAFDTFAVPGRREFDHQSLPGGGEFDLHALAEGNLNCTHDFM